MRVSTTDSIEGSRVVQAIGAITATSSWHASGTLPHQGNWRERLLADLIRRAEDIGADAIVGVNYQDEGTAVTSETGVALKRVMVTGTAVRLARAA
ncbi:heavy metal-binding domain-containing protein [Beijerinckia indica]|uniref:Heavy metal-binding domain-containing protein n=1 Tax=Beijerinckia indica subsp. indica (strain ATCC 9039 / DSM 1715 / NCIMB 8712) TaxID=395963 RepID=B2IJQ7_BEII9|nr:heavy metal-binding domain-containing protein [Beijerinckia indica]ACB94929.1 protein of unknown function DUF74 [Beijerinckia indica subsp. indica ATCC 9039]